MGKIFNTQTYLQIKLTYTADIANSISSVKIKYKKTSTGTIEEWDAVHDIPNKAVYYNVLPGEPLEDYGNWIFWIYAVMDDTRILIGEETVAIIYKEGANNNSTI